ncbi:MAG TPA: RNA polymerase sigma factor [Ktedonobacterales bacterium]|nr:RNA polymerase sigma factor [Ktedonobacterales bacterium]
MIWTISSWVRRGTRGTRPPRLTRWLGALTGASPLDETPSGGERRATTAHERHMEAREATFEQFFHAHESAILGYLWRITGDEQVSHDIAQETFLRAWQRFEQVSRYEQPRAWLFRVATNLASNHRRHRSIHDAMMAHFSPAHPATLDPAAGVAESAVVRAALLAMPVRQRSALVLRVVYGLSIPEIAEALGASKAAAAMTLSRAREAFRAHYTQEETR